MSRFCLAASLGRKNEVVWLVSGSGVCELTTESRLGIWEESLKEARAITVFKTEGDYSAEELDSLNFLFIL